MEIKYKNKYHRTDTISRWRCSGVIYDDWDELYYTYIRTLNCCACNKDFKNSLDRCLDHDHETGLLRAIVCQNYNKNDSYIKYPNGYDKKKVKKEYLEQNKEQIREKKKKFYEENKEKINKVKKKYYEINKEKLNKQNKEYREVNKEKLNKKYECECGGKYTHRHKHHHLKTIKHIAWFMEQVD